MTEEILQRYCGRNFQIINYKGRECVALEAGDIVDGDRDNNGASISVEKGDKMVTLTIRGEKYRLRKTTRVRMWSGDAKFAPVSGNGVNEFFKYNEKHGI